MIIGIPKEIKDHEKRVILLPDAVAALVRRGHRVWVQRRAGVGSGYEDFDYQRAGARLVSSPRDIYRGADLILKVKEPLPREFRFFHRGLVLFCFLHLAADKPLARALQRAGVTALGFETLEKPSGVTPLLKPMSEIAGRLSVQLGVHYLRTDQGGKGVLLSPTDYSEAGNVTILGGGNVGRAAAEAAAGLGARVRVMDLAPGRLEAWARRYSRVEVMGFNSRRLSEALRHTDLAIGAAYVPGARAPRVIKRGMVKQMQAGSVLVDVAVDQGGTSETTRPTSLSRPVYTRYGVIHCAVPNLPALVSHTASKILSKAVLPYVIQVAEMKEVQRLLADKVLATAVNVHAGRIIHPRVRDALGL